MDILNDLLGCARHLKGKKSRPSKERLWLTNEEKMKT